MLRALEGWMEKGLGKLRRPSEFKREAKSSQESQGSKKSCLFDLPELQKESFAEVSEKKQLLEDSLSGVTS